MSSEFKQQLISFLEQEKELYEGEIREHKEMSQEDRAATGLLIRNCKIDSYDSTGAEVRFTFSENTTRIRAGDSVTIIPSEGCTEHAKVHMLLEVGSDFIVAESGKEIFDETILYNIEVNEVTMFDTFMDVLKESDEFSPGAFYLDILAGNEAPEKESMFGTDVAMEQKAETETKWMNAMQAEAVKACIKQPSLYLIQGPPGTGKTRVLSAIAGLYSSTGKEVAVTAKTHQAVNNALNRIKASYPDRNVIKIGQAIRSEGLNESVIQFYAYKDYLKWRKRSHRAADDIVGMTLQAATVNMCIKNSGFQPHIVLTDEASQIPVAEASVLGACGAGTFVFIGDDKQMPPIFHESINDDSLATSIFSALSSKYPKFKTVLNTTFRMNDEICAFVGKHFYKEDGIDLVSDSSAHGRRLSLEGVNDIEDALLKYALSDTPSIIRINASGSNYDYTDSNTDEAILAARIATEAIKHGLNSKDIAVVTPFRRQVNTIRNEFNNLGYSSGDCPLVDTVERLQGQDVEMIILSFCVSNPEYYRSVKSFLENRNRLNVMISRAKTKVIILSSPAIDMPLLGEINPCPYCH